VPDAFARGASPELAAAASAAARGERGGRVLADGPIAATALRSLAARRPAVYVAHNLESAFRHEIDSAGLGRRGALERFERGLLERFAESWMVSRRDIELAKALAPGAALRYVPNVVDVAAIEPLAPVVGRHVALLVADFTYAPNQEGLRFLVDDVLPRAWNELPDARLVVVGRGLEPPPDLDPRVEVRGFVPDLRSAYADAACVVVPLLHGGGSPLKFVEALAYGLPVVATPLAASGLEARPGAHYVEGDDAAGFAAALCSVLRDGAPGVAAGARELAMSHYSIEALVPMIAP